LDLVLISGFFSFFSFWLVIFVVILSCAYIAFCGLPWSFVKSFDCFGGFFVSLGLGACGWNPKITNGIFT
jgi:hypothetical protein